MMLKPEEDDGYCSRSSLDSPTQVIKGEMTNCNTTEVLINNNKESKINQVTSSMCHSSSAPSFLEVMLMRDDWKKVKDLGGVLPKNVDAGVTSTEISQDKLFISNRGEVVTGSSSMRQQDAVEKIREREFQPRKLIKLMPSSSQNMLFFTKQSALSGLVVSTKSNLTSSSMTFQSLIKNNQSSGISNFNNSQHVVVKNSNITLPLSSNLNKQSIRLTAAEVLKSKINHNSVDISNKVQPLTQVGSNKKVAKELNSQTSNNNNNNTFTSARTGQPYIRGSRGWGSRAKSCFYAGRQELHPVIDHDYCEFSAFNAEIQSGIILMSSETCARTDRLNLKRNKANNSTQPTVQTIPLKSNNSVFRSREASPLHVHRAPGNYLQQVNVDGKKKCLKRKMNDPSDVCLLLPAQPVKNSVGRPRLSGKFEKSHQVIFPKKTSTAGGYDSSDDFASPPLTADKNYVKIPGSFQNDFVYFATTRGRSSRKKHSDKLTSQAPVDHLLTSGSGSSGIKAFEWYKEMAQTDKSSRFGNAHQTEEGQVEMGPYLCSAEEDGKTLISESEVADLVMQMLPSPEASKDDQVLGLGSSNNDVMTSDDILTSNDEHNLMEHFIDINNIDLNVISGEFSSVLSPTHYLKHLDPKQDSVQDHQNFHSLDFPLITSTAQLLDDINDNDLLITSEIASMNALLKEFSGDDNMGVCDSADVLSHIPSVDGSIINDDAMVMCLLDSTDNNKLLSSNECDLKIENHNLHVEEVRPLTPNSPECFALHSTLADDIKTFNFNSEKKVFDINEVSVVSPPMDQSADFPSLLTPPPSLPPSASPPELITVNMFWNDLPGLLIENREYVRLVDIHKQIMPAKDTGILKKRCAMLNLEVSFCSEMQRDFLIRYMNATKSKSRVIVTKNTALALISFYVSPRMKALVAENGELDHHHTLKECLENGMRAEADINRSVLNSGSRKTAPDLHILQVAPENNISQDPATDAGMISDRPQKSIKRSPRLVHKRFSYLDLINNGFSSSSSSSANLNNRNASTKNIKSNSRDSPNISTQSKYRPLVSALKAKLSHKSGRNSNMYPQRNESIVYKRRRQLIGIGQGRNNLKKITFKSNSFLSLRGSLHYGRQLVEETSTLSEEPTQKGPSICNAYAAEHCYAAYPSSSFNNASPVEDKSFSDESEVAISEVSSHFSHEEMQAVKLTSEEDCEGSMTANETDPSETYLDESLEESKGDLSGVAYFPGNLNLQQEAKDKPQQSEPVCDFIHLGIDHPVENFRHSKPNLKSSNFPLLQQPGSDRVLRSSTSTIDSKNTILSTKNRQTKSSEASPNRNYHSTSFYSLRHSRKLDDKVSNENRSPRMIRNKKHILKMFHTQSILKRPIAKSTSSKNVTYEYKSHSASHALVKRSNVVKNGAAGSQQSQMHDRPHRLARKKFDVLKF